MSEVALKLLEQIRGLPGEDQLLIADELAEGPFDEDAAVAELHDDPEFQAMLDERLREVEEHPERLLDGETVMAELRRRFNGHRLNTPRATTREPRPARAGRFLRRLRPRPGDALRGAAWNPTPTPSTSACRSLPSALATSARSGDPKSSSDSLGGSWKTPRSSGCRSSQTPWKKPAALTRPYFATAATRSRMTRGAGHSGWR